MGCINVTSCIFEGCNNPNEQQQQQQEEEEEEEVLAPSVGAFGRNAGHGDGAQGHARAASRVAATDFCEGGGPVEVRVWLLRHEAFQAKGSPGPAMDDVRGVLTSGTGLEGVSLRKGQ